MHEKTGHDNKGMSGHGFTFPGGGSVPVIFISMVNPQVTFTLFLIAFRITRGKARYFQSNYCNGEMLFRSASESCTFRIG